jgi:hypothetical protein
VRIFSSIAYRKVIASVLLVVFIFIYAEKVFHTHQGADNHTSQKAIVVKLLSANCAICDFQVAKNAEIPVLTSTSLPLIFLQTEFAGSFTCYHYLPATQISNRGPPVS